MHLLYLASALRKSGFAPVVLDANAFRMSDEQVIAKIQSLKPLVCGLSLYSEILAQVREMTRLIRSVSASTSIVLGGPHATAIPAETLSQFPDADYVLTQEAEESLPMLCRALSDQGDPAVVGGIFYRDKGRVVQGPPARLPDIQKIPLPARDLVQQAYTQKRYYSIMVRQRPVDTLFTSRGCPFRCGFCYNFRFKYRGRSPEAVVDELVRIRDRGIRDIEICDDTFTAIRPRAMKIFDLIIKEKLDVSFRIKSRVDVFTEQLAKKASEAGVYLVAFGMESGSQRMLDAMNKKTSVAHSARACELTRKYRMLSHSSWIVGYPGETLETVSETYKFIRSNRPSTVNIAVLRPYPKTLAYEVAAQSGNLVGDWNPDSQQMPWVRLPWAPEKKILDDLCLKMMRRIYFTPHYAGSFAARILRNANWTLAKYAVQESRKVVTFKRKR
jgi:radical SAM superfamily enzyme YgiQ (UPF0313 family)